jgi:hypothetical protein
MSTPLISAFPLCAGTGRQLGDWLESTPDSAEVD